MFHQKNRCCCTQIWKLWALVYHGNSSMFDQVLRQDRHLFWQDCSHGAHVSSWRHALVDTCPQDCATSQHDTAWELIVSIPTCVPNLNLCLYPWGRHQILVWNLGCDLDSWIESLVKSCRCHSVHRDAHIMTSWKIQMTTFFPGPPWSSTWHQDWHPEIRWHATQQRMAQRTTFTEKCCRKNETPCKCFWRRINGWKCRQNNCNCHKTIAIAKWLITPWHLSLWTEEKMELMNGSQSMRKKQMALKNSARCQTAHHKNWIQIAKQKEMTPSLWAG